jgi:hypothetical protein
MKINKKAFLGFVAATALALVVVFVPVSTTHAANLETGIKAAQPEGAAGNSNLFGGSNSIFSTVVNVLLFIIGAISVIMLIIGGIRYTISAGDSGNVTAAKNTIMYAIIGLIVAFLAFAIVNWVLGAISGKS